MLTHRQMPSKSEMNLFDPFSILSTSPVNSLTSMMSSSGNFSDSVSSLLSFPSSSSNSSSQQNQQHPSDSPVVDEIWKKFDDFILTPPQSPPVKLDLSSHNNDVDSMLEFPDLDFDLSAALDGLLEEAADAGLAEVIQSFTTNDLLHDCMWGGGSSLDGSSQEDRKCGRVSSPASGVSRQHNLSNPHSIIISSDSSPLLGTSPFSSLCNDMLACEEQLTSGDSGNSSMADEEEVPIIEDSEEDEDQSLFISGSESLIDHSYDGACHASQTPRHPAPRQPQSRKERKASSTSTSSSACSSLLYCSSPRKSPLKKASSKKARTLAQQKKEELLAPVAVKFVKRCKTLSTSSTSGKAVGVRSRKGIPDNGKNTQQNITSGLTPSGVKRKQQQLQSVKQCKSAQGGKKANSMTTVSSSLTPQTNSTNGSKSPSSKGVVPFPSCVPSPSPSTPVSSQSTLTVSLTPSTLSTSILKVNGDFSHKKKATHCYPEKRREHNDSEKKRRDHLRNAFHTLRDQIPKLRENNNKKPPRIIILYEAVNFVNQLTEKSQYLEKVKRQELEKNERLRKKLAALQSSP